MLCDGRASLCCAVCYAASGQGRLERLDDGRNGSGGSRTNEPVKKVNKALNSQKMFGGEQHVSEHQSDGESACNREGAKTKVDGPWEVIVNHKDV